MLSPTRSTLSCWELNKQLRSWPLDLKSLLSSRSIKFTKSWLWWARQECLRESSICSSRHQMSSMLLLFSTRANLRATRERKCTQLYIALLMNALIGSRKWSCSTKKIVRGIDFGSIHSRSVKTKLSTSEQFTDRSGFSKLKICVHSRNSSSLRSSQSANTRLTFGNLLVLTIRVNLLRILKLFGTT